MDDPSPPGGALCGKVRTVRTSSTGLGLASPLSPNEIRAGYAPAHGRRRRALDGHSVPPAAPRAS